MVKVGSIAGCLQMGYHQLQNVQFDRMKLIDILKRKS